MTDPIQMPNGELCKRLYACDSCSHVSDSHDGRADGPRTEAVCENCGEPTLLITPGEVVGTVEGQD